MRNVLGLVLILCVGCSSEVPPSAKPRSAVRTIARQTSEYRDVGLCRLASSAHEIVRGRVVDIGETIQLDGSEEHVEGLFTPITIEIAHHLKGASSSWRLVALVDGEIAASGASSAGPFRDTQGKPRDGFFFLIRNGEHVFLRGGGGYFWFGEAGELINGRARRNGITAAEFMRAVHAPEGARRCEDEEVAE